jgi:serine/threonine protein kinase
MGRDDDPVAATVESDATFRVVSDGGLPRSVEELPEVRAECYVRIDEFARGGLGRIVRAHDTRTGRLVAIKEMLTSDADAAARFVREALVTANLQHPAIVPVYEVGRWPSGQPFYAMKLVRGRPLAELVGESATLEARLALLPHAIAVADALAYAHGEHVIHRDLKPQNVLVGTHGETVVIDWGLARRDGEHDAALPRVPGAEPGQTVLGSVMGTPAYMAPEQARGDRVDARADVYAIGALLYHLLAGRPPYSGGTVQELLDQVRGGAPPHLRSVAPAIPPDLAAIVERAMARDGFSRYASAAEIAIELRRFMNGQLVLAHHYTRGQRLLRFIRKQRVPLAIGSIATIVLAVVATVSLRNVLRSREDAQRNEREAASASKEATRLLRASYLDRTIQELAVERPERAFPLLAAATRDQPLDPATRFLAQRVIEQLPAVRRRPGPFVGAVLLSKSGDVVLATRSGIERWSPSRDASVWKVSGEVSAVAVTAETIAVIRSSGIALYAAEQGAMLGELVRPGARYTALSVDTEQRWVIGLADDHRIDIWKLATRTLEASVAAPRSSSFTFVSNDGLHVLQARKNENTENVLELLDRSGRVAAKLCDPCAAFAIRSELAAADLPTKLAAAKVRIIDWQGRLISELETTMTSQIRAIELGDHRATVALAAEDGSIELLDRATRTVRWRANVPDAPTDIRSDDQGRVWVLCTFSGVFAFDVATGIQLAHFQIAAGEGLQLADDGTSLMTWRDAGASWLHVPQFPCTVVAPSSARVEQLAYARDGTLTTASRDGQVVRYDTAGRELARFHAHARQILSHQVLGDGTLLTSAPGEGTVLWDTTGHERTRVPDGPRALVSPDETRLATTGDSGEVTLWDRATGRRERVLGRLAHAVIRMRWTKDSREVAAIDDDGEVRVWNADNGDEVRALPAIVNSAGLDVVVSPDARWLVRCLATPAPLSIYSLVPGTPDQSWPDVPAAELSSARFSVDGSLLALGGNGFVGVWEVATRARKMLVQIDAYTSAIAFAPGERLLYSVGLDRALRVWNVHAGQLLHRVQLQDQLLEVSLSPDGSRAAIGTFGPALLIDTTSFTGDRDELEHIAVSRTSWQLDSDGRLVDRPVR